MEFLKEKNALTARRQGETLRIEAWGKDSLRVRAWMYEPGKKHDWALTEPVQETDCTVTLGNDSTWNGEGTFGNQPWGEIRNGRIRATVNFAGVISFFRDDKLILREYYRSYGGTLVPSSRCLKIVNREWKGIPGASEYCLKVKFDANDGEKLYGMGQYQQPWLELKGSILELAHRNSQISVPFAVSSLGYGMLWNNPAVGSVTFGKNYTEWIARATRQMDYWITAADGPKEILKNYTDVTGRAPRFPENLMALPDAGRGAVGSPPVSERGNPDRSDRDRLLPLDRTGRLEV